MRRSLGSIEDLGGGRFRISVSAGFNRKTGKRIRRSQVVRGSRREAERALSTMLMRAGKMSAEKTTLDSYLEDVWLPTKETRRRKTYLDYESKVRSCIVPYIGQLQLQAVDAYVVERWMADLQRDGKSPQTIVNARSVLKNAMRAAVRWRLIDRDPTDGTERPRVDYQPVVLTLEQMEKYLDAFAGHPIEPLIILAIAGGLRRSELCALEWADIDFTASTVAIRGGLHQYGSETWREETKSQTSKRTIGLPEWAIDLLRPLRGVGPLVSDRGAPVAPDKVSKLYDAHVRDCELPRVPLRDLRNSHGTFLYASGVDISFIADRLGHSDTAITRKHYVARSHANAERVSVAALSAIRPRQNVPNAQDDTEQSPGKCETDSTENREVAQ